MRTWIAAILGAAIVAGSTVTAWAATLQPSSVVPAPQEQAKTAYAEGATSLTPAKEEEKPRYQVSVDTSLSSAVYDIGTPFFYTYGPQDAGSTEEQGGSTARIAILPQKVDAAGKLISDAYKITWMTATVEKGSVVASVAKNDGTLEGSRQAPVLTIRSSTRPGDCIPEDYAVRVDLTVGALSGKKIINQRNVTLRILGRDAAAYARSRDIENGGRYQISQQTGCVFRLWGEVDEKARVACNDQVDVVFQGNYGTANINLLVETDPIEAIEKRFGDASVQYIDFVGAPKLIEKVQILIGGPQEAFIYQYDAKTDTISRVASTYTNNAHVIETTQPGCYFLSDKQI